MIRTDLTNAQKVVIDLSPKDDAGNPRALDGAAVWASPDPNVTVENVSPDGLHAELVPADGFVGVVVCTAADADGDPAEQFELTVSRVAATSLGATVSVVNK